MSDYESCPACGDPIDYCQGHGEIGDPEGYAYLKYVEACSDEAVEPFTFDVWFRLYDKPSGPLG